MTFIDWLTNKNNPSLEKSEYLYGPKHLIVLIIAIISCFLVYFIFRNKDIKVKNKLFNISASILLFFEIITRIVSLIFLKEYTLTNVLEIILPRHICSVIVWVFIVGLYTKKKVLLDYSVICGLLATGAFLIYPSAGINYKYMSFTNIYSTFTHMLGFVTACSLLSLKMVKFKFKEIYQPLLCFTIMFSYGALLNFVIFPGSDYMFMRNDPLELNLNFPYQILYAILLIIYTSIFYIVSYFIDKKKKAI